MSHPKRRSMRALAKELGVSPATVSRIASGIGSFSEEIMKKGIGFDASNYGYAVVEKSDMVFIPDPDTAMIDPFCEIKTLSTS